VFGPHPAFGHPLPQVGEGRPPTLGGEQ